jgi:UDP-N-acetyl-2-amino-2-deoxyglucuronate dehydrogenase
LEKGRFEMIRTAILGMGGISGAHIDGYKAFPERCKVIAGVDIYPEKGREKMASLGLDAPVYASFDELLDRHEVDLVSICTPPFTHRDLSVKALKKGIHVLLEKPMAPSLEECDAIIDARRESGAVLSVVAQNRFKTPIWNLKKMIEKGAIGKLLHTQVNSYWWRGSPYYDLWWRGTWEKEGGGCTLNHAVHHIDMMLWFAGMPKQLVSMIRNVNHRNSEVEDLSMALMDFTDGSCAQLTSSLVHHGEKQEIILQGTDARISAPWEAVSMRSASNGFPEDNREKEEALRVLRDSFGELSFEGHTGQINDLLRAIESNREPLITGRDGRNAIELIMAVYKSGSGKGFVELPLSRDDPFYTTQGVMEKTPRFYEKKSSVENLPDYGISLGSSMK